MSVLYYGKTYWLYTTSGGSADWALGEAEISYVYSIELRDTGDSEFILRPTEIIQTDKEIFDVSAETSTVEEFAA